MPLLRLYLFGAPRIEQDGEPVPINRRKTLALLVYLAVANKPVSREALATLLWPDYDQSGALANLRRDLSRLKKALGGTTLVADRSQAELDPQADIWIDINDFQKRVKQALEHIPEGENLHTDCLPSLEEAVKLYKDDFLAGFTLPDSPAFDEWQFFQAERLRRTLVEALQGLIRIYTRSGQYEAAIGHARRWLSLDNLHEPAHRTVIHLYAWNGQRAAALRQFEECQRLLKEQLGVEPEEETRALYLAVKSRQLQSPVQEPPHPLESQVDLLGKTGRTQLPSHGTTFIGRENDLAALGHLLERPGTRFLTIQGPGGIGKTRLAIETARSVTPHFPDGVFFVPLAPLHSPADIPFTIAESLGYQFRDTGEPIQHLLDFLHGQQLLLVLDNFEHLLEGAGLVAEISVAAPGVKLLVTSRERLNLSGEQVYILSSLDFPVKDIHEDVLTYDSVQVFLQSVHLVRPDFTPQAGELQAIVRICQLVQGMPLALVLAAGWSEVLSFEEIADEIAKSLDILETELQDIPDRQRSVRAAFKYSWNRLSPEQQQVYIKLSVFRGGFTRQAAQAVAGADLKTIRVLVNKSWLHLDANNRFQVHELLRQFAMEKLLTDAPLWEQVRARHGEYIAGLLESLDRDMRGPGQKEAFHTVAIEFENIRTAWYTLIETHQLHEAVEKILPALFRYCEARWRAFELFRLLDELERVLSAGDDNRLLTILRTARASFYPDGMSVRFESFGYVWSGIFEEIRDTWPSIEKSADLLELGFWGINLAYLFGRTFDKEQGIRSLKDLFPSLRKSGMRWELAYGLQHLAQLFLIEFDPGGDQNEIEQAIRESLEIFEQLGDVRESGYTLKVFGQLRRFQHRIPEAIQLMQASQEKVQAVGDWVVAANIHGHLGDLYLQHGASEEAFHSIHAMAMAYLEKGHKRVAAWTLSKESYEALRYSTIEHALQIREQCLTLARETGDDPYEPWYVWELGEIYRVSGDEDQARLYYEKARELFEHEQNEIGYIFYHRGIGELSYNSGDYTKASHHFEKSLDLARKHRHEWAESYALNGLGRAAIGLGNLKAARSSFAAALRLARKVDDRGIALVCLACAAEYLAASEDSRRAVALAKLVEAHPVSWHETKARARRLIDSLKDSTSPGILIEAQTGWQDCELWDVVNDVIGLLSRPING